MTDRSNEEHLAEMERIRAKLEASGMMHAAALVSQAMDTLLAGAPLTHDEIERLEAELWSAAGGRC